jgi:hypothetical protein
MSLLFVDGFDHWAAADASQKWPTEQSQVGTMSSTTPFSAGKSMLLANVFSYVGRSLGANHTTLIAGFHFNVGSLTFVPWNLVTFLDAGTVQLNVGINGSGAIVVYRNTTLLATSSAVGFNVGWHFLEAKVTFHATTGSYTVKVDGVQVLTASSVNTAPSGNALANWLRMGYQGMFTGNNFTDTVLYDNLYLCNSAGSVNNDFLGEVRIQTLLPNAVGASSQLTRTGGSVSGNYTAVNEASVDGDTSYVSSNTVGQQDTYKYGALTANTASVLGLASSPVARRDDAGQRTIATRYRHSNNAEADFATTTPVLTAYLNCQHVQETNPVTTSAWVPGDLANEFGPKVAA